MQTIKSLNKLASNKNNGSNLTFNKNNNNKSASKKNDNDNMVNRFNIGGDDIKHVKK